MTYSFKEVFLTLQGEGGQSGRVCVFARFAGCNLWSGREADRAGAACDFCDTDFVGTDGEGGGKFDTPEAVAAHLAAVWGGKAQSEKCDAVFGNNCATEKYAAQRAVVFTGGEPLLQLDEDLIAAVKRQGFHMAVETNGTMEAPAGIDWICVSPKGRNALKQTSGQELKLVWPQAGIAPSDYEHLDFSEFRLSPLDNADQAVNIRTCIDYCLAHPNWRLSLQTHKIIGVK